MFRTQRFVRLWFLAALSPLILFFIVGVGFAQSTSASVDFSISGKEHVSQSFSVLSGDTLSVGYTVESSNESSCISLSASVETSILIPPKTIFVSQTPVPANTTHSYRQPIPVNETGTLTVTFSPCSNIPACKGSMMILATYEVQTPQVEPSLTIEIEDALLSWGPIAGALILVGIVSFWLGFRTGSHSKEESQASSRPAWNRPS